MNKEIPNEVKTAVGTFTFNEYGNPEYRCTGSQWLRKHNFIINSVTKSNIVLHEGNYYFNPRGATLINDTVQKSDIGALVFDPNTKTVKPNCEAGKWLKENQLNPDEITIDNFKYAFKSDHWRFISPSQKSDIQEDNQQQTETQKSDKQENNQQQIEAQKSDKQIEKQAEPSYEPIYNFQLQQQQLKNKIQKRKQVKKLQELLNAQQMQYIHQMRELLQKQKEYQTKQIEILKQTQIKNQKQLELQEKLRPRFLQEEDNYYSEYNDYYDNNDYNYNADYYEDDENSNYYEEDEISYYENLNYEYDNTNPEYSEYNEYEFL